jgi:CubicO group peptidase (beta-lactamase class C family)
MMTRRTKILALVSTMIAGLFNNACAAEVRGHEGLAGRWGGSLSTGPRALRLVLEISPEQGIVLTSVDQGNARIPATGGTCTAREVDLAFASVNGRLKLALDAQGALAGTWHQGPIQPIKFTKLAAGQIPTPMPYGDLQTEVTSALSQSGAPALTGAFMAKKTTGIVVGEAVDGVLVFGQAGQVKQGLKWHVGSITKSMTATLVARLVERGLIRWDVKLGDAFGDLAPDMLAHYRGMTLAQLMTGQAGMPTNISLADRFGHETNEATPTQSRKLWVRQAFAMKPETGFVYPNNGYVLAGALCEKLTGKAYETLMQEEVFGPLGIGSAGFGPPPLGNPQGHRNALLGGRTIALGVDPGADNPAGMSPAGAAHMTMQDLAKFGLAHSEGHQGLRNDYLKQETWQFLHTPPATASADNKYAFGWVMRPDGTLWHNGSNTYWIAELAFDPTKSLAACASANLFQAEPAVGRVLAVAMAQAMIALK